MRVLFVIFIFCCCKEVCICVGLLVVWWRGGSDVLRIPIIVGCVAGEDEGIE